MRVFVCVRVKLKVAHVKGPKREREREREKLSVYDKPRKFGKGCWHDGLTVIRRGYADGRVVLQRLLKGVKPSSLSVRPI